MEIKIHERTVTEYGNPKPRPPKAVAPPPPPVMDHVTLKSRLQNEQFRVMNESRWAFSHGPPTESRPRGHYWVPAMPNHTYVASLLVGQPRWVIDGLIADRVLGRDGRIAPHPNTSAERERRKPTFWSELAEFLGAPPRR